MPKSPDVQSHTHVYDIEASVEFLGEQRVLKDFIRPGMRVLDVGCGATGRSSLRLTELGAEVTAIDYNEETVEIAKEALREHEQIVVEYGDMLQLQYEDESFDFVFVALCGLDYMVDEADRMRALQELARVLKPGGRLAFSSLNRIGVLTSPDNLASWDTIKWRITHIASGRFLQSTLLDVNGLRMRQRLPQTIIRETRDVTGLEFEYVTNTHGSHTNRLRITMTSWMASFVFRKPH